MLTNYICDHHTIEGSSIFFFRGDLDPLVGEEDRRKTFSGESQMVTGRAPGGG